MLTPRRRTKLSLIAIASVLAGCGASGSSGSSAASPSAYVKAICSTIGPFEKDVASRSSALSPSSINSAAEGKTALIGFLGAMATDTDHAVAQLKAAGTPNVKNGKAIAAAVVSAFTQLKTALAQASAQAAALPTSSPTAFRNAANTLGKTVRTSMSGIGSGLTALTSPDLEKAAAADATCRSLATG
jgi:hypothetical protein